MAGSVSELREELLKLTGGTVDIQLDEDTFKSTYQIMKELSEVWGSLTDISKANILEMVGGKRNANVVAALLENFQIAEEAFRTSQESAGSAMRENEKYVQSIAGRIEQFKAAFQSLSGTVVNSDLLKFVVSTGTGIVSVIDAIISKLGALAVALGAIAGVKYLSKLVETSSAFEKLKKSVAETGSVMKAASSAISSGASTATGKLVSVFGKTGLAAGGVIAVIMALAAAYKYLASSSDRAVAKHKKLVDELESVKDEVDGLQSKLDSQRDRLKELNSIGAPTLAEGEEIAKLSRSVELLEKQLEVKRRLAELKAKEAASSAYDSLTTQNLYGTIIGGLPAFGFRTIVDEAEKYKNDVVQIEEELIAANDELIKMDPASADYARQKSRVEYLENRRDSLEGEYLKLSDEISTLYDGMTSAGSEMTSDQKAMASMIESLLGLGDASEQAKTGVDSLGTSTSATSARMEQISKNTDSLQERISSLSGSLSKLRDGEMDVNSVIDLIQQFPELASYVDLTSESFGDLETGLENVIRESPKNLIADLKELRETAGYTDEQKKAIDALCDALENMSSDAIKDASGEFGVLADSINKATKAKNDLDKALQEEDYDSGYERRVSAFTEFSDVIAAGEFGSKAFSAYKEYFGLVGKTSEDIKVWMEDNKKYFAEGTEGIEEFLKTVDRLDGAGGALEGIASYDSETGDFRYDINNLGEFAKALGWTEEMLQDFIYKYRMYVEDWTSRTAEMNQTEFINKNAIFEMDGSMFADLDRLQSITNMTKEGVAGLISEINALRESQGLEGIQILGVDQVTITQGFIDNLRSSFDTVEEFRSALSELSEFDGVKFEAGVKVENVDGATQTIEEFLAGTETNTTTVRIQIDGSTELVVAEETIQRVCGTEWEARLNAIANIEDIEEKEKEVKKICDALSVYPCSATIDGNSAPFYRVKNDIVSQLESLASSVTVIPITASYTGPTSIPGGSGSKGSATSYGGQGAVRNYSGTKSSNGGLALLGDEDVSGGRRMPELVVTKDYAFLAGTKGPELRNLNKGDIVLPYKETKKILDRGSYAISAKRFKSGTTSKLTGDALKAYNRYLENLKKLQNKNKNSFGALYTEPIYKPTAPSYTSKNTMNSAKQDAYAKPSSTMRNPSWSGGSNSLANSNNSNRPGGSGGGGVGGGSGSGSCGSGSDSSEKKESEFERQYKEHNHLLNMEKEKYADYIKWLEKAYQDAYAKGEIELDDYRKYAEEVFNGQKEIFKDSLSDIEHQIQILERGEGNDNKVINLYLDMIKQVEKEIQAAKDRGLTDNDDWVQELQDQLHDYQDAVKDIQDEIKENAEDAVKDLVDYRIDMLKQELQDQRDALRDKLSTLRDFYNKQKDMLQESYDEEKKIEERNEKRKKKEDIEAELAQLQFDDSAWAEKRRLELQEQLASADKELQDFEKSNALEDAKDLLDKMYEKQEEQINKEIEAIEAKLNDPKMLYNQALKDIQNNTQNLFLEMVKYNDKHGSGNSEDVLSMWNESKDSLDRFLSAFGKAYKDIIMVAPPSGGYASGTRHATRGVHRVDERGAEWLFQSGDGSRYRVFSGGEKVLNASGSDFLYKFAMSHGTNMPDIRPNVSGVAKIAKVLGRSQNVNISSDVIIQGNANERTVSEIRRAQRENVDHILKEFTKLSK